MSGRILISPLDWGLGHATRCIPLIEALKELGYEVILGGSGNSLSLLQSEFPHLRSMGLPPYDIKYSGKRSALASTAMSAGRIYSSIRKEHEVLKEWISDNPVDLILSDNRYGLYDQSVPSIFIGHQINIMSGIFSGIARSLQRKWVSRFDHWIIPDCKAEPGLAGKLSHPPPQKTPSTYIGPLSRLRPSADITVPNSILIIVTGPAPRSHHFARKIADQLDQVEGLCSNNIKLVLGWPEDVLTFQSTGKEEIIHLPDQERLKTLLHTSEIIVSRSGYSSIMDMTVIGKHPVMVPTPGQPEQEYLGSLHDSKTILAYPEEDFHLPNAIDRWKNTRFTDWPCTPGGSLSDRLKVILKEVMKR